MTAWPFQVDCRCHGHVWPLMIQQGLCMCYKDAVTTGKHNPQSMDIEPALLALIYGKYIGTRTNYFDKSFESDIVDELLPLMLEHGAIVTESLIAICLHFGLKRPFTILLQGRSWRELQWNGEPFNCIWCGVVKYGKVGYRKPFAPLYELAVGHATNDEFEGILGLLLDGGEDLDAIAQPDGALIHCIIEWTISDAWVDPISRSTYHHRVVERLSIIIRRGANVNTIGPRGTPLQQAWNQIVISYDCIDNKDYYIDVRSENLFKNLLKRLIGNGASIGWQAADGSTPTKEEILAWRNPPYQGDGITNWRYTLEKYKSPSVFDERASERASEKPWVFPSFARSRANERTNEQTGRRFLLF
ncbi:MAG: hypothetical protein M1812_007455 [Candelaria pacifica]|nr:MAG: hypothetical protein M1812_007455 [Candelaria pacifica]